MSRGTHLADCHTQAERDVIITYRRIRQRKGMTDFSARGLALAEEMKYGADLSPDFVTEFSNGTREINERGNLGLTSKGKALLMEQASA
jgi:hypothetical protein